MIEVEAVVAERGDHRDAALIGVRRRLSQRHGQRRRSPSLAVERRAQAHVDHVGARAAFRDRRGGVIDPLNNPGEKTAAAVEHFHPDDGRPRRDADRAKVVRRSRDDAGDVRPVPERIRQPADAGRRIHALIEVERPARHKRSRVRHIQLRCDVDVGVPDAAVNDRHARAGADRARGPGSGRRHGVRRPLQRAERLQRTEHAGGLDAHQVIDLDHGRLGVLGNPLHHHVLGHRPDAADFRDTPGERGIARGGDGDADLVERRRQLAPGPLDLRVQEGRRNQSIEIEDVRDGRGGVSGDRGQTGPAREQRLIAAAGERREGDQQNCRDANGCSHGTPFQRGRGREAGARYAAPRCSPRQG